MGVASSARVLPLLLSAVVLAYGLVRVANGRTALAVLAVLMSVPLGTRFTESTGFLSVPTLLLIPLVGVFIAATVGLPRPATSSALP